MEGVEEKDNYQCPKCKSYEVAYTLNNDWKLCEDCGEEFISDHT